MKIGNLVKNILGIFLVTFSFGGFANKDYIAAEIILILGISLIFWGSYKYFAKEIYSFKENIKEAKEEAKIKKEKPITRTAPQKSINYREENNPAKSWFMFWTISFWSVLIYIFIFGFIFFLIYLLIWWLYLGFLFGY